MFLKHLRKVLKRTLTEAQRLKMDAIPNIIRAHYFLSKITWTLLLFGAAATCVWFIVKSTNRYASYGVATNTRSVEEERSIFPTIVLCSMMGLSNPYATHLLQLANVSRTPSESAKSGTFDYNYGLFLDLQAYMKRTHGRYFTTHEKRLLTFDLGAALIDCHYQSRECSSSEFEWFFHPFFLGCYRFNKNGDETATKEGRNSKLYVQVTSIKQYTQNNAFRKLNNKQSVIVEFSDVHRSV